jgi:hypothetical protein
MWDLNLRGQIFCVNESLQAPFYVHNAHVFIGDLGSEQDSPWRSPDRLDELIFVPYNTHLWGIVNVKCPPDRKSVV